MSAVLAITKTSYTPILFLGRFVSFVPLHKRKRLRIYSRQPVEIPIVGYVDKFERQGRKPDTKRNGHSKTQTFAEMSKGE